MTPFGELLRRLRAERGVSQKELAAILDVSPAYLSALEHGKRGVAPFHLRQKIIAWANVIWDEAEEVERIARLSDPRPVIDVSGADARRVWLANHLAERVAALDDATVDAMLDLLDVTPSA